MRRFKLALISSVFVISLLACKTITGLQQGLQQSETQVPAMLTAAPTMMGALGTAAAEFTPPAEATSAPDNSGTPTSGSGLGISLDNVKNVMGATQQFEFKDGTVNGQPAAIARLSGSVATSMPGLGGDFSAAFIGDPANLSEIKITAPYSEDPTAVSTGLGMVTMVFSSILPPDTLLSVLPWITDNYSKVAVGASEEMTTKNMKFTISRTKADVILDIVALK